MQPKRMKPESWVWYLILNNIKLKSLSTIWHFCKPIMIVLREIVLCLIGNDFRGARFNIHIKIIVNISW